MLLNVSMYIEGAVISTIVHGILTPTFYNIIAPLHFTANDIAVDVTHQLLLVMHIYLLLQALLK